MLAEMSGQPRETLQITNSTSEDFLHVFLQLPVFNPASASSQPDWTKAGGAGTVYSAVEWGSSTWKLPTLGADAFSECVIPKGEHILLHWPTLDTKPYRIMALRMVSPRDSKRTLPSDCSASMCPSKVLDQNALLVEGGPNMVADVSAVDGINFRVRYTLSTSATELKTMEVREDPCALLPKTYMFPAGAGCHNPAKIDCAGRPSCECKPSTQDCAFNTCSHKLFDIPVAMAQSYPIGRFDGGNAEGAPIKRFINNVSHLRKGTPLQQFCSAANGVGDFTAYCYDYNDVGSSPYLRWPYIISLEYFDPPASASSPSSGRGPTPVSSPFGRIGPAPVSSPFGRSSPSRIFTRPVIAAVVVACALVIIWIFLAV